MGVQSSYNDAMTIGFAGQLMGQDHDVRAMSNSEASQEIAIGQAVCFGATDFGALSPDATTDVICGIVAHTHAYATSPSLDLGTTGIKAGVTMNVVREGRMLVVCENGCVPGDRLHVRVLGGTEGALRSAADGVNTIDSTKQGIWLTTASAGGLAELQFSFVNKV